MNANSCFDGYTISRSNGKWRKRIAAGILGMAMMGSGASLNAGGIEGVAMSDGVAVAGVVVEAYSVENRHAPAGVAVTGAGGGYQIAGLAAGNYRVRFDAASAGYYATWFGEVLFFEISPDVVVGAGMTSDVDVELTKSARIAGRALDGDGAGIQGVVVRVLLLSNHGHREMGTAITGTDGSYTVGGFDGGAYAVEFACSAVLFQTTRLPGGVTVADAVHLTGVDLTLSPSGGIEGTVTGPGSVPLAGVAVTLAHYDEPLHVYVTTDANGQYFAGGLVEGDWHVTFNGTSVGYSLQYYDNTGDYGSATPVGVGTGNVTSGINAALLKNTAVSGVVTNVSGAGIPGVQVNVWEVGASWSSGWAVTGQDGSFVAPTGGALNVQVNFNDPSGFYESQWFDGVEDRASATPLTADDGGHLAGIDAVLAEKSTGTMLWGRVTGEGAGGIAEASISVSSPVYDYTESDWLGWYLIRGLPAEAGGEMDVYAPWGSAFQSMFGIGFDLSGGGAVRVDVELPRSGSISGRVVDENGDGIPWIYVRAYDPDNEWGWGLPWADTDEDGYFNLVGFETGSYKLAFTDWGGNYRGQWFDGKADFASADTVAVVMGEDAPIGLVTMSAGAAITGTVRDAVTSNPIPWATVTPYDAGGNQLWPNTTTNISGEYRLSGLAPGTYRVSFSSGTSYYPQFYNGKADLASADPVVLGEELDTAGIDANLQPGATVSGQATDAQGNPLAGVSVEIYRENSSWNPATSATTDAAGEYSAKVTMPTGGRFKVKFSKVGFVPIWHGGGSDFSSATAVPADALPAMSSAVVPGVDAQLEVAGAIRGTLVDNVSGQPIHAARARAYAPDGWSVLAEAWTNAQGVFVIQSLAAGDYHVEFGQSSPHQTMWFDGVFNRNAAEGVNVVAGQTTETGESRMVRWGTISGTVTDAWSGDPLVDAVVGLYKGEAGSALHFAYSDSAGNYSMPQVAPGSDYRVRFTRSGYAEQWFEAKPSRALADGIVVAEGVPVVIDAALSQRGTIAGTVTDAWSGAAMSSVTVTLYAQGGQALDTRTTAAAGTFSFTNLEAGTYKLGYARSGFVAQWFAGAASLAEATLIEISGLGTHTANAALVNVGRISGVVLAQDTSQGLVGANVGVYTLTGSWVTSTTSTTGGQYVLSGINPGTYRVRFAGGSNQDYLTRWFDSKVLSADADPVVLAEVGSHVLNVNASLPRGATIQGTVTDVDTGAPIPSASASLYKVVDGTTTYERVRYTASNGTYVLSGLEEGTYRIVFAATAYLQVTSADVAVTPPGTATVNAGLARGATIAGTVTDGLDSTPVESAQVTLYDRGGNAKSSEFTNAAGGYEFVGVTSGSYEVRFAKTGFFPVWFDGAADRADAEEIVLVAPQDRTGVDAMLFRAGQIAGRVLHQGTGNPLHGAVVNVLSQDGTVSQGATTTADGTFTVGMLAAGQYTVEFSLSGFVSQWFDGKPDAASADHVTVTLGQTTQLGDIALMQRGAISGVITDSGGAPLEGAWIGVYRADQSIAGSTFTAADGTYQMSSLLTGSYKVFASKTGGYLSNWFNGKLDFAGADSVSVVAPATTPDIDITLATGGSISGIVTGMEVDGTIAPINGASIMVSSAAAPGTPLFWATTNAAGAYSVVALQAGDYVVRASAGGYRERWVGGISMNEATAIPVVPPDAITGADLVLPRPASLTGTLVDSAGGSAIEGVLVNIYSAAGNFIGSTTTDSLGVFSFVNLDTSNVKVLFDATGQGYFARFFEGKDDLVTADPVALEAPHVTDLGILPLVQGGTISGTVRDAAANPIQNASVVLSTHPGNQWLRTVYTNASGFFQAKALVAGDYKVTASASGFLSVVYDGAVLPADATPVIVSDGVVAADIDFALPLPATITGTVTGDGGLPVESMSVFLLNASKTIMATSNTNADGQFAFNNLWAGTYYVQYQGQPKGYLQRFFDGRGTVGDADPITLSAGDAFVANTAMVRPGSVSGIVRSKGTGYTTEAPLANVGVFLHRASDNTQVTSTSTGLDGTFMLSSTQIVSGDYIVRFQATAVGFFNQWFPEKSSLAEAEAVQITEGQTLTGIDGWLVRPRITVTASGEGSVTPVIQEVPYNSTATITMTPAAGWSPWRFEDTIQPGSLYAPSSYELSRTSVIQNRGIEVFFEAVSDLVVSDISIPSEAFNGEPVAISWTLTNHGAATAIGPWTDRVFISADDQVGADVYLADFPFTGLIAAGESITRTQMVTIPKAIDQEADYHMVVRTDLYNYVREGHVWEAGEQNNSSISAEPILVRISPAADLVVASVTAPASAFSGQDATFAWTVQNIGNGGTDATVWYDRVYLSLDDQVDQGDLDLGQLRNGSFLPPGESYSSAFTVKLPNGISGQYYVIVRADIHNNTSESDKSNNTRAVAFPITLTPPPDLQVTAITAPPTAFSGQSATLSWTVTNMGTGPSVTVGWTDSVYLSENDDPSITTGDKLLGHFSRSGALNPGNSYTLSRPVNMPAGVSGPFFYKVWTDAGNQVFEHTFAENNITASQPATNVILQGPDLEVVALNVTSPLPLQAGHPVTLSWTVENFGTAAVPNNWWYDSIYLSETAIFDSATAVKLGDRIRHGGIGVGATYDATGSFVVPNGITGPRYLFVVTNSTGLVVELDHANNTSDALNVQVVFNPADLAASQVTAAGNAITGEAISLSWTVTNEGAGKTVASAWTDRVYITSDANLQDGLQVLGNFNRSGALDAGEQYSRTEIITLPYLIESGTYYLAVMADVNNAAAEDGTRANNIAASELQVTQLLSDLTPTALQTPSSVSSGSDLMVNWTVTNQGQAGTNHTNWYERIYLSPTADIADPNKINLGTHYRNAGLAAGSGYSFSREFTVPRILEGAFYVGIEVDLYKSVADADRSNNVLWTASPIDVTFTPASDLAVENIVVAPTALSGRPLQVTWTVRNLDANTDPGVKWDDSIFLSRDKFLDASDTQIGWVSRNDGLAAGATYTQSGEFNIPLGMSGPLYVFVVSDRANRVFEDGRKLNNTAYTSDPVIVSLPEPSDLRVRSIVSPEVAVLGQAISVTFEIENVGTNPAPGGWSDAVYLSPAAEWSPDAVLLGRVNRNQPLDPGASFSATLQSTVPGLMPGDYHVLVRTDVFNNVLESDENNNLAASDEPVAIDAPLLILDEEANFNLALRQSSYYRLEIDTSGDALLISLDATSSNAYNELYIAYGRVPTRGDFDFAFSRPYAASQEIVVPSTRSGTYYILAYANHASGANPVSLEAQIIPFSIRSIDPVAGGDTGNLTLKILGARFTRDTTFALMPDFGGGQRVEASRVYYRDSGIAFATFNLAGAAHGPYSIEARDPAFPVDILDGALDLHAGLGARLEATISGHSSVREGREYVFYVNYGNIGDADAVPPILIVRTTSETPFGPSLTDLGTEPRQFLAGSPAGVPGILRPGELYSVPFYFRTSSATINFTVQVLGADDEREIDWDGLEASVRPEGMDELAWDDLWERVRDHIGVTWGDYVATLSDIASLLGWRGENTYDLSLLWEELFAQAGGYPTAQIGGTLVHADTGEILSGITMNAVMAEIDEAGEIGESAAREVITDGAGRFLFRNLEEGVHVLGAYAYEVAGPPRISVGAGNDVHGLIVYARPVPPPVDWTDIVDSDVLPTPLVDSAGVSHIIWLRGGDIWHAWHDGSDWVEARAITDTAERDTGVIDSLSIAASATLLDSSAPGIVATWRAGDGNASAVMHAVGRALGGGGYEWSVPAPMTDAPQADRHPALLVTPSGRALMVFQRYLEGDAALGEIPPYDDPDLYFGLYDLYADELEWQALPPSGTTSFSQPLSMTTNDFETMDFSTSFAYDVSARTGTAPGWIPVIGGKEAKYKMTLSGTASQGCDELRATMEATGEMVVFDKLTFKLTGGGNIKYTSNVKTGGCPDPQYIFSAATLHLGVSAELFIPAWVFEVPGDGWIAENYIKAQIGPVIGVGLSGMGGWTSGSFPSLPNTGEINLTLSIGGKGEAEVFDGTAKGTVSLIGSVNFELVERIAKSASIALSMELEVGNRRQNFAKTWTWERPAGGWWSSSSASGMGSHDSGFTSFGSPGFSIFGGDGPSIEIIEDESGTTTITTYPIITRYGPVEGTTGYYASTEVEPMDIAAVLGADVQSSIYRDGPPALSRAAAGGLLLAWKKDLPSTEPQGGQQVLVSTFNEGTGHWSPPTEIPGGSGYVGEVVAVHSGATPMVLWTASDSAGIDDATPVETVMSRLETRSIWFSVFSEGTWTAAVQVSANGMNTRLDAGVAHDGRVLATWMRNSTPEGQRDLMVAWWDGSVWTSPAALFTGALEGIPSILAEADTTTLFWEWNVAPSGDTPSLRIGFHEYAAGSWSEPFAFAPAEPAAAFTAFSTTSSSTVSSHGFSFPPPVPSGCCPPKPTPTPRPSPTPPPERTPPPPKPGNYGPPIVRAVDPNDILGPDGFGPERWIRSDSPIFYTIRFENDPEWATAPAQQVIITMTLDPDLDPRTFRVGGFGWATHHFDPAESRAFYSARLDLRDEHGYFVDVFAFIDTTTGEATWTITTIDPETGQQPLDGSVGFLMPNDETGIGDGYVTFTATPRRNLASGTIIDAEARIIFDTEAPIDTPPIFNTLDTAAPSSHVLALPARVPEVEFLVSWTGEDDEHGSGLAYFEVFVSENDGPFVPWLKETTLTQAPFIGELGSSYAFYSQATDNTGLVEIKPESAEAVTICGIETFTLTYTASVGGSITGESDQSVQTGSDGSAVHAVSSEGFVFHQWSDGRTDNPRTDTNVQESLAVSALFDPATSAGGVTTHWYRTHGLGPAPGSLWSIEEWNALDGGDSDGDGADNRSEFIAGTNPSDPNSVLRVKSLTRSPDGSMTLRWPSVAGRVYFLDWCLNLNNWTEGQTPIPATPPFNEHQVAPLADPRQFWRVRVQME